MRTIDVVGAVIVVDGAVLCVQRGAEGHLAGLWEFPGGKVEAGETPREALAREIREELRCEVSVGEEVTTTVHEYDVATVSLTTFFCDLVAGIPRLTEHQRLVWVDPAELESLEWAPADVPAVTAVRRRLSASL